MLEKIVSIVSYFLNVILLADLENENPCWEAGIYN